MARGTFQILCLFITSNAFPAIAGEEVWRAGVAKVCITPDLPTAMSGYGGRDAPADGKLTELWAKALVLEVGQHRGVIITLDLVGIDRTLSQAVCDSLSKSLSLQRRQIAIYCSHTHTGPVVGQNLAPLHYLIQPPDQQKRIDDYALALPGKILDAVTKAVENLAESQLAWGNGRCTFAVNRRENKPYEMAAQWRTEGTLRGPIDHDVPVLIVRGGDDKLKAILFGYACHATVLSVTQWSGDYPGYAQIELEKLHPDGIALFWAGCGADQNPLPRRSIALAEHYGKRLAHAVQAVILTQRMTPVAPVLETKFAEIQLPLADLPTPEQVRRSALSANRYEAARARQLLRQLEHGPLAQTYPYPVSSWRIGTDVQFVSLGGEVVVDYANRLKTELHGINTWVAGYAHDVMAYIPSRRVWCEGGYEGADAMVYYGLPTVWAPNIETKIIAEVHRQWTTAR